MGANGKVVLPPEAESEAWTQAEINLFRSSNGFVRPKRGEEVKKPAKALTPRQKAALKKAEGAGASPLGGASPVPTRVGPTDRPAPSRPARKVCGRGGPTDRPCPRSVAPFSQSLTS